MIFNEAQNTTKHSLMEDSYFWETRIFFWYLDPWKVTFQLPSSFFTPNFHELYTMKDKHHTLHRKHTDTNQRHIHAIHKCTHTFLHRREKQSNPLKHNVYYILIPFRDNIYVYNRKFWLHIIFLNNLKKLLLFLTSMPLLAEAYLYYTCNFSLN